MREQETISFKSSPEFADWLGRAVSDLDMSRSEVVRACIVLGLPALKENPALVEIVTISARNMKGHNRDI